MSRICPEKQETGEDKQGIINSFINTVFWILKTETPWRGKGLLDKLLEIIMDNPDFECLMIDASHIKAHPHAAEAKGGNKGMGRCCYTLCKKASSYLAIVQIRCLIM